MLQKLFGEKNCQKLERTRFKNGKSMFLKIIFLLSLVLSLTEKEEQQQQQKNKIEIFIEHTFETKAKLIWKKLLSNSI